MIVQVQLLVASLSLALARSQIPFPDSSNDKRFQLQTDLPISYSQNDILRAWQSEFSAHESDPDIAITKSLRELYPNHAIRATDVFYFDIAAYAANAEHQVTLHVDNSSVIKRVFAPTQRRSESNGALLDNPQFATMQASYTDGTTFDIVYGSWVKGFNIFSTVWIITAQDADVAQAYDNIDALMLAVGSYGSSLREAIWSFQSPGFWRQSHTLWQSIQSASWDDVILNETIKTSIRRDVEGFFQKEQVYEDLGVPWKRGVIMFGPAGNGKTISLKAFMKSSKVPTLYVRTLTRFGSDLEGIIEVFQKAREQAPCLLIIEDLDSLINDENRSAFLNELDGLESNDGILILATTNHLDRIDGALANRPSRFDRKYLFDDPDEEERKLYARYWQNKLRARKELHFDEKLVDRFAKETFEFSFAYMKEAFVSSLLLIAGGNEQPFASILSEQIHSLRKELRKGTEANEKLLAPLDSAGRFVATALASPNQLRNIF